ncbi:hypothetical protein EGJ27_03730 [Pseudomonas sp. v388]|nr:hypothetical protein EGJ27_03730 [Pseudomonas sp. v388]
MIMVNEDNGPDSAYPGPAEPGSQDETYPDLETDADNDDQDELTDDFVDSDLPDNSPVDESEEPSPGSSA